MVRLKETHSKVWCSVLLIKTLLSRNNIQLSPKGEVNSGGYVVVQFLLWNNLFLNWDKIV